MVLSTNIEFVPNLRINFVFFHTFVYSFRHLAEIRYSLMTI